MVKRCIFDAFCKTLKRPKRLYYESDVFPWFLHLDFNKILNQKCRICAFFFYTQPFQNFNIEQCIKMKCIECIAFIICRYSNVSMQKDIQPKIDHNLMMSLLLRNFWILLMTSCGNFEHKITQQFTKCLEKC